MRLLLDRQEDAACSDRLVIKQLGVDVALAPNAVTTIDLPATAAGTYSMTCGMGMMSGQLVVGGAGATARRRLVRVADRCGCWSPWARPSAAIYLARRKPRGDEAAREAEHRRRKKRKS